MTPEHLATLQKVSSLKWQVISAGFCEDGRDRRQTNVKYEIDMGPNPKLSKGVARVIELAPQMLALTARLAIEGDKEAFAIIEKLPERTTLT